jgi:RNA-directed DNA polymerase
MDIDLGKETFTAHRSGNKMETKLTRIAERAQASPEERFTSLYHLINTEMLMTCHTEMETGKASGVDGVTKEMYEQGIETRVTDLVERLKRKGYRPQPARRIHIPKDEKSTRPLGIPCYEDKLVQKALKKLLEAIYEQDFLEVSYGFRPKRGMHDALRALNRIIERGKISYIVDVDIRGFFNHVDHDWLIKFLELRIGDPNLIRLVKRMLKAGVEEDGNFEDTEEGTPQGSVASPILANVYLHYVLDTWFAITVKKQCKGQADMVRFADDFVCCFQYKEDAERFYTALLLRLAKFKLEVSEDKTKIIRFGRYAEEEGKRDGEGKPNTFDFLGFTHYCGKSKKGSFRVKRQTSGKKFKQKVKAFNTWMRDNRHEDTKGVIKTIRAKLQGHYNYYGITDNFERIIAYRTEVLKLMKKWLNRRSQRKSYTAIGFQEFLTRIRLPKPKIKVSIYE